MGSVAARDTWNFTIEDPDAEFLAFVLSKQPSYLSRNVKRAVFQRALTRLGMHAWLANPDVDLASLLPPKPPSGFDPASVPVWGKAGTLIKHPATKDDTDNVHKAERDLGPLGAQPPKVEPDRKPGGKGTRKSGDPRQHGPSKAKIRKRDAGPDTPEERREREGR